MRNYYIYRITNLVDNKTYIGQHLSSEEDPINDHYMGSGKIVILAEKKYGIENFKKEILARNIATVSDANELEISYIKYERIKVHYGLIPGCYNIADGGGGSPGSHCSAETRAKIGYAASHCSAETRAKMSATRKGKHWYLDENGKRVWY